MNNRCILTEDVQPLVKVGFCDELSHIRKSSVGSYGPHNCGWGDDCMFEMLLL